MSLSTGYTWFSISLAQPKHVSQDSGTILGTKIGRRSRVLFFLICSFADPTSQEYGPQGPYAIIMNIRAQ